MQIDPHYDNELLTPQEVADILKVSIHTVMNYFKSEINPLPVIKITSSTYRVRKSDLLEWMKSLPDPRMDV